MLSLEANVAWAAESTPAVAAHKLLLPALRSRILALFLGSHGECNPKMRHRWSGAACSVGVVEAIALVPL